MVAGLEHGSRNKLDCLSLQHPRAGDFLLSSWLRPRKQFLRSKNL